MTRNVDALINERRWIQTSTGLHFWPLEPDPADVTIEDIARGLANTCRYSGQLRGLRRGWLARLLGLRPRAFYSVAEHSVIVSRFVPPELALEGLLHDAAEAYIGDMVRPLKHQPELSGFRVADARIDAVVRRAFGLRDDDAAHAAIKVVDDRILADEIRAFMRHPALHVASQAYEPLGARVRCLPPRAAERAFLRRYRELTRQRAR